MGKTQKIGNATIMNIDCMEYMRTLPDKFFDLAIVLIRLMVSKQALALQQIRP